MVAYRKLLNRLQTHVVDNGSGGVALEHRNMDTGEPLSPEMEAALFPFANGPSAASMAADPAFTGAYDRLPLDAASLATGAAASPTSGSRRMVLAQAGSRNTGPVGYPLAPTQQ